jgi:hypothetical protein
MSKRLPESPCIALADIAEIGQVTLSYGYTQTSLSESRKDVFVTRLRLFQQNRPISAYGQGMKSTQS